MVVLRLLLGLGGIAIIAVGVFGVIARVKLRVPWTVTGAAGRVLVIGSGLLLLVLAVAGN
jgi:hypothetical protein